MSYHPEPNDYGQWQAFLMIIPFALVIFALAMLIGAC